ncbi:MAG: ankyrin repeat domain-containing protein [Bacillota bacterium]|jgi:ankyrin repeat protein|nr:ankyrin repeat domain-containing protein [Bacillota bacterium]
MKRLVTALLSVLLVFAKIGSVAALTPISNVWDESYLYVFGSLADINKVIEEGSLLSALPVQMPSWRNLTVTPLMAAAGHNQDPEVIRALVNAGLDVDARTSPAHGWTALMYAIAYNPNPQIYKALQELGALADDADYAAILFEIIGSYETNRQAVVGRLVELGFDLAGVEDSQGRSPLIASILSDDLELTGLFLRLGVDKDKPDRNGKTPLMYAAHRAVSEGHLLRLLDVRADPHATDSAGMTALHYAVRDGSLAQVEDLVLRLWRLRLEDEANAETQISLYASGSLAEMVRERQKEEDEEAVLIRGLLQRQGFISPGYHLSASDPAPYWRSSYLPDLYQEAEELADYVLRLLKNGAIEEFLGLFHAVARRNILYNTDNFSEVLANLDNLRQKLQSWETVRVVLNRDQTEARVVTRHYGWNAESTIVLWMENGVWRLADINF